MKYIYNILAILFSILFFITCDKKTDDNPEPSKPSSSEIKIKIGDARKTQHPLKAANSNSRGIDPLNLAEFELSFKAIYLLKKDNKSIPLLVEPVKIDLRKFEGTVSELVPAKIETGTYTTLRMEIDGVKIKYNNNTFEASVAQNPTVTIESISQTVNYSGENPFKQDMVIDYHLSLNVDETQQTPEMRIHIDALSACRELPVTAPVIGEVLFAAMNTNLHYEMQLEKNIQQIKHSPPLEIKPDLSADISYHGIHTFIDFEEVGGEIISHTSQHVFRGNDGSLLIDVEDMFVNPNALDNNTIMSAGETNVKAIEVFKANEYKKKLEQSGHKIEDGGMYFFSLRKTWTIQTGNENYQITRLCEPIPVYYP